MRAPAMLSQMTVTGTPAWRQRAERTLQEFGQRNATQGV